MTLFHLLSLMSELTSQTMPSESMTLSMANISITIANASRMRMGGLVESIQSVIANVEPRGALEAMSFMYPMPPWAISMP